MRGNEHSTAIAACSQRGATHGGKDVGQQGQPAGFWRVWTYVLHSWGHKYMSNGNNCAPPFVFPSGIVIRAPLLDRRLNSTAVRQDICALYIGEEVTGCRAGMAQSVLRNLSPMWAGPRDWRIDGDPKRLRICFHSEWSPSAWLEREPTKLEKTLSNDR